MTRANQSGRGSERGGAAPAGAPQKYLLITSDDMGMCHAVNAGITRGMTEGVITSSTLMAPCPWFAQAVALVKKHQLKVGIHLCLTCEWDHLRWGPLTRASSLTGPDGYFWSTIPDVVQSARDEEIAAEFEAQVERVRTSGVEPTHIDIHMLSGDDNRPGVGRIREALRRCCRKHGLVYLRDENRGNGYEHLTDQIGSSGLSEEAIWEALEGWTQPGFYHIIGHAAAAMPELDAICSDDHPSRDWAAPYRLADMVFFTRPATRQRLAELGFQLVDVPTFLALKQSA